MGICCGYFRDGLLKSNGNGSIGVLLGSEFTLSDGSKIDLAKWFSTEITELRSGRMNAKREQMIHEHLVLPGFIHEENLSLRARPRKVMRYYYSSITYEY